MIEYKSEINELNAPLFILIHGRGGNSSVMNIFKKALPEKSNIIFPQAPLVDNVIGGFSWWQVDDPDLLNTVKKTAIDFLLNLDQIITDLKLTPSQIHLVGFSQGAALSSACVQLDSRFSSLAMLCGFTIKINTNFKINKLFIFHGLSDNIILYERAIQTKEYFQTVDTVFLNDNSGHKITQKGINGLRDFFIF